MPNSYGNLIGPYGVSFSPDNSKLYSSLSIYYSPNNAAFLYQYDLSSGIPSTIIASQTTIATSNNYFGAIQIGSDSKMYVTTVGQSLGVINNPNNLGASCNFQNYAVVLPYNSEFGLPNFIDSYNYIQNDSVFSSTECKYIFEPDTLHSNIVNSNFNWSTGDTTETTTVKTPGVYWVSFINPQGCQEIDTFHVYNLNPPIINVIQDRIECGNIFSPITITATYPNALSYNWSDGYGGQTHSLNSPGIYWIDFTLNNSCVSRDSFNLQLSNVFNFSMPNIVTPNNDGINDFIDFGKYQFTTLQLEIYDRWGQSVFESDDVNTIWKPILDDGTYFYTAQYQINCDSETQSKSLKGFFTIIR